jgi:mono/diheme cytochrome c family protein
MSGRFAVSLCLFSGCLLLSACGKALAADSESAPGATVEAPAAETKKQSSALTPAERGYKLLRTSPYAPAEFTVELFDRLWEFWPAELKRQAAEASLEQRRQLAFSRYGMVADPANPMGPPLGAVDDGQGGWVMNCLACHQGKVEGRPILGVGNSHFAFQTLTGDVAKAKQAFEGKRASGMSGFVPLGLSNGTTNAQVFSVVLTAMRDKDLNPVKQLKFPKFKNHDLDAPPFWNVKHKRNLYIDGFVPKTHRVIMQFALVPTNTADSFKEREDAFRDILAWIESLEAPEYSGKIDTALADQGRQAYERVCADCHGTPGVAGSYPERTIAIDEIGTDRTRLDGMPAEHRRFYRESWFGEYGKLEVTEEPAGYVAPPLDGVWASAPYFHNGSVPTLWHVLHPEARPAVWQRTENGYDHERMGLEVQEFAEMPAEVKDLEQKRSYFNTALAGKSAAGHTFPNELTEDERRAVLEYLKTF